MFPLTQIFSLVKRYFPLPSLCEYAWGILVVLVSLMHFFIGQLTLEQTMFYSVVIYGVLTPFSLAFFRTYTRPVPPSLKGLTAIIGFLFSQFVTIGQSYFQKQDWSLCFGNWTLILIWCIQTLCYGYIFYRIVLGIMSTLQNHSIINGNYKINAIRWFFFIVFVKTLYFAAFYPCIFDIDAAIGLRTFLDPNSAICDHHPLLIQSLHGFLFLVGKNIGHSSWGFALFSIVFICISSAILVYGLSLLELTKINKKSIIIIALIFTLFPLFPYLNLLITKDGLFAYSFLLYVFTLYELVFTRGDCFRKKRFVVVHIVSILLVCFTRHQGVFIIIFEFALLLLCYKNNWKKISAITLPALFFYFIISTLLFPLLNVEPGGKQEIYGTMFHQTAHYLYEYYDEATDSELDAIHSILDEEKISKNYRYNLTDGSKDCYKYNPMTIVSLKSPVFFRHINRSSEGQELQAYRSAWLTMLFEHPLSYLKATMGVFIGFFYNNGDPLIKVEPHWATARFAITPEYLFWHFDYFEKSYYRQAFHWAKQPIICWFFSIPYYLWAAIIALCLLLYRRDLRGITIFLPVFLSLGLLLICPYASGRYAFPIVISLPLLIIYLLTYTNNNDVKNSGFNSML